jgi:RNA polymerase sigma-70 factor (ECF subfamily)
MSACRRILGDEALAEDAAQEVFVLYVRKRTRLPAEVCLGGWFYRSACHVARTLGRERRRRAAREEAAMRGAEPERGVEDERARAWAELAPWLDEAMAALPERRRDLVVARYFEERSQRELAVALGWSEAKVSRELRAALDGLRRRLGARGLAAGGMAGLGELLAGEAARGAGPAVPARWAASMAEAAGAGATGGGAVMIFMTSKGKFIAAGGLAAVVAVAILGGGRAAGWWGAGGAAEPVAMTRAGEEARAASVWSPGEVGGVDGDAEARAEAWLRATRVFASEGELDAAMRAVLNEGDVERRLALLAGMGVSISREGLGQRAGLWRGEDLILSEQEVRSFFAPILAAWAREQPAAAMAWLLGQPGYETMLRARDLQEVVTAMQAAGLERELRDALLQAAPRAGNAQLLADVWWLQVDPAGFIQAHGGDLERRWLLRMSLDRLAGSDPAAAWRTVVATGDEGAWRGAVWSLARRAGGLDATLAALAGEPEWTSRPELANALRALGADPTADFAAARALLRQGEEPGLEVSVDEAWIRARPEEAVRAALARTDDLPSFDFATLILNHLPTTASPEDFAGWIAAAPVEKQARAWESFFSRVGRADPVRTLGWIERYTGSGDRAYMERAVLRGWAERDVATALEWVAGLPAQEARRPAWEAVVARELAKQEPELALGWVAQRGGRIGDFLAMDLAEALVERRGEPALGGLLERLPEAGVHDAALGAAAARLFDGRWAEAAAFVEARAKGDVTIAQLRVLAAWPLPNSPGRTRLAAQALEGLVIEAKNEGAAREVAGSIGHALAVNESPAAAFAWSARLPEALGAAARAGAANYVYQIGREKERGEFLAELARARIGEEERAALRRRLNGAGD